MSSKNLATVTTELITSYGNTARNVIQAYRVGNERITRYVDQRWSRAVDRVGGQLSTEVRQNALAAQQKVTSYYAQGISFGSDRAEVAVNKAVELAGKGVDQIAANANRFEKATGVTALHTLAAVAVPAAVAVSGVALKVEAQSDQLVQRLAGTKARPKARAKTPAKAKRQTKTRVAPAKRAAPKQPVVAAASQAE